MSASAGTLLCQYCCVYILGWEMYSNDGHF